MEGGLGGKGLLGIEGRGVMGHCEGGPDLCLAAPIQSTATPSTLWMPAMGREGGQRGSVRGGSKLPLVLRIPTLWSPWLLGAQGASWPEMVVRLGLARKVEEGDGRSFVLQHLC